MILSGADVRLALMARRSELIRCASITKDDDCTDVDLVDVSDS